MIPFLGDGSALIFDTMLWSTVLTAFLTSISTKVTTCPLSRSLYQPFVFLGKHVEVECSVRKPNCSLASRLFEFKCWHNLNSESSINSLAFMSMPMFVTYPLACLSLLMQLCITYTKKYIYSLNQRLLLDFVSILSLVSFYF